MSTSPNTTSRKSSSLIRPTNLIKSSVGCEHQSNNLLSMRRSKMRIIRAITLERIKCIFLSMMRMIWKYSISAPRDMRLIRPNIPSELIELSVMWMIFTTFSTQTYSHPSSRCRTLSRVILSDKARTYNIIKTIMKTNHPLANNTRSTLMVYFPFFESVLSPSCNSGEDAGPLT